MKHNTTFKVARVLLPQTAIVAGCYAAMFWLIICVLRLAVAVEFMPERSRDFSFASVPLDFVPMFIAIMGCIFLGIYFEPLLSMGVTRKAVFCGHFCAIALLSAGLCVLFTLIGLSAGAFDVGEAAHKALSVFSACLFYELTGCVVVVGCLHRRVLPAMAGILAFAAILAGIFALRGAVASLSETGFNLLIPSGAMSAPAYLLLSLLLFAVLSVVIRRAPAKC